MRGLTEEESQWPPHPFKYSRDLPDDDHDQETGGDLGPDDQPHLVVLVHDPEGSIDHESEEGMHGADIIQHVVIVEDDAAEGDEEIQPPHHLVNGREKRSPTVTQCIWGGGGGVQLSIWEIHQKGGGVDLSEPREAEVLSDIVVGEVPKSGHPNITRDKDADGIVDLRCREIVVHQEHYLKRKKNLLES